MRILFASFTGISISIGLFFVMHLMISSDNEQIKKDENRPYLIYLSDKQKIKVEDKKRVKPKEPKQKKPAKKIKITKTKMDKNVAVKPLQQKIMPKVLNLSPISSLSGAKIQAPMSNLTLYDAKSLAVLRKVNPKYPRRAKLKKITGFVELSFLISKGGTVSNIVIVEANPKNVFEKSAINAIKRWKFKKSEEEKNATITFNFRLAK